MEIVCDFSVKKFSPLFFINIWLYYFILAFGPSKYKLECFSENFHSDFWLRRRILELMAFYLDHRYLQPVDADFVQCILADLQSFLTKINPEEKNTSRALLFPPFTSYHRYLLHRVVLDYFPDELASFSIGSGEDRRTCIYFSQKYFKRSIKSFSVEENLINIYSFSLLFQSTQGFETQRETKAKTRKKARTGKI